MVLIYMHYACMLYTPTAYDTSVSYCLGGPWKGTLKDSNFVDKSPKLFSTLDLPSATPTCQFFSSLAIHPLGLPASRSHFASLLSDLSFWRVSFSEITKLILDIPLGGMKLTPFVNLVP